MSNLPKPSKNRRPRMIPKRASPLLQMAQQNSSGSSERHTTTQHENQQKADKRSTTMTNGLSSPQQGTHIRGNLAPGSSSSDTNQQQKSGNESSNEFNRFVGMGKEQYMRKSLDEERKNSALSLNQANVVSGQRQQQGDSNPTPTTSTSTGSGIAGSFFSQAIHSLWSSATPSSAVPQNQSSSQWNASAQLSDNETPRLYGAKKRNTSERSSMDATPTTTTTTTDRSPEKTASKESQQHDTSNDDSIAPITVKTPQLPRGDPTQSTPTPSSASSHLPSPLSANNLSHSQISKFKKILLSSSASTTSSSDSLDYSTRIDLNNLRKVAWNGITEEYRAYIWKLLIGYLPVSVQRQKRALKLKREEYSEMVQKYFYEEKLSRTALEKEILKQIKKDVPRTHPSKLFQSEKIMQSLERLLYIWSIRHPASGYVQGIDNLATPFFLVFLSDELHKPCHETLACNGNEVDESILKTVECDTFWCLDSFLNFVQDFYTHGHPGIYKVVNRMENIIKKSESQLSKHLESLQQDGLGLHFAQFGFRWVNCLLMREFDLLLVVRLFDSYIAEGERLAPFITFLCASLLKRFSSELVKMDYIEVASFFQDPPTKQWKQMDALEELLGEAFILQNLYESDGGGG